MTNLTVKVPLAERAYDIRIGPGLLATAGVEIEPLLRRKRVCVVSEERVAALHFPALQQGLARAGIEADLLTLPAGEATKCWRELERTVEWLLAQKVARDDVVIAFGGGVIGDLVGFAAAILRRGVRFVQIPSTLLAQVDSSVGGKTGINSALGKNLIGAFHQPSLVLADTDLIATLLERDYLAGYAEVAKYGLLGDEAFFDWLEAAKLRPDAGNLPSLMEAIRRSCEMKADIVVRDETEQGDRALLNLGHTFGHALEAATGYSDRLLHGEAVSVGCLLAFQASAALGLCSQETPSRVAKHFSDMGMKHNVSDIAGDLPDADGLLDLMSQDKKVKNDRIVFVLARGIGEAFVCPDADIPTIRSVLSEGLRARAA
ncbi:MAG: 3-dehydroquinate synthase [Pseudomonadota bacterium]